MAPAARAQTNYNFSFSGNGITTSGWFSAIPSGTPGTLEITGIGGTFADANVPFSGAITGLYTPVTYSTTPGSIAFTSGGLGLSYDDLFYPAGDSPAVCPGYPFAGGDFDVYGLAFNVAGGFIGGLWSDGVFAPGSSPTYGAGAANAAGLLDDPGQGNGEIVTGAVTPEPGSTTLLAASALSGLGLLARRRLRK
jgi:hypothetical protein